MYKGDPSNVFQTSKGINVSVEKIEKFCTISQNFRNINIIYFINYYYVISKIMKCFYILAGVAVGGGWQALVAYINLFCYYIMGLPLGFLLGYKLGYRVEVKYQLKLEIRITDPFGPIKLIFFLNFRHYEKVITKICINTL